MKKRLFSLLLAVCVAVCAAPIAAQAGDNGVRNGDIIEFGSYPHCELKDEQTKAELTAKLSDDMWKSYGYYSGNGRNGSMVQGDWMKYADLDVDGDGKADYRAVTFTQLRPYDVLGSSKGSYQDDNGYAVDTVYWFSYEPLNWIVVDVAKGLVMTEDIIDSQAYSNTIYQNGKDIYNKNAFWNDASSTNYANDYATSSIRKWLNDDFYNTAFGADEKARIIETSVDNSAYDDAHSAYGSPATNDNVFLLSYSDVNNADYFADNSARMAKGTDYAKIQGLDVDRTSGSKAGNSVWRLRTAGKLGSNAAVVTIGGAANASMFTVKQTSLGIRPAISLKALDCDHSDNTNPVSCTETTICSVCGGKIAPTGHDFSQDWICDDLGHWHECVRCSEKADYSEHSFEWVVDKEATKKEAGEKHEECTVCHATRSDNTEIPKLKNVFEKICDWFKMAFNKIVKWISELFKFVGC